MSLRILGLHGYRQNGNIMGKKLEALFGKKHILETPTGKWNVEDDLYGWWELTSREMFIQSHEYNIDVDSLPLGEFDIVFGFSQGAVCATILLGLGRIQAKKVILCSGSGIMDEVYIPREKISTLSLFCIGEKDPIVTLDNSRDLQSCYINIQEFFHTGGHVIPSSGKFRDAILTL